MKSIYGFVFNDKDEVLLCKGTILTIPEYKAKENECPFNFICSKMQQETGLLINTTDWKYFASLNKRQETNFTFLSTRIISKEKIKNNMKWINKNALHKYKLDNSLIWLIPLAYSVLDQNNTFSVGTLFLR